MFGNHQKEIDVIIDNSAAFGGNCHALDSQVALSIAKEAACSGHGRSWLTGGEP